MEGVSTGYLVCAGLGRRKPSHGAAVVCSEMLTFEIYSAVFTLLSRVLRSASLVRAGFAVDRVGHNRCTERCEVAYRRIEVPTSLNAGIWNK
jgi:hypothetical protein